MSGGYQGIGAGGHSYPGTTPVTPGGGGMEVGGSITNGTAGRVLYEDAGPVLADSSQLTFSASAGLGSRAADGVAAAILTSIIAGHVTSATATAGIGAAVEMQAQNDGGSQSSAARVAGILRNVSAAGPSGGLLFQIWTGGAWATQAHAHSSAFYATSVLGLGTINATGTTSTLWDLQNTSSMYTYRSASASVGGHAFVGTANTSGARSFFAITPSANTGTTASTAVKVFDYQTHTHTWATGAGPAEQSEFNIAAPTYAAAGASVFPLCTTLYVSGAPIAGANMTITKALAAHFDSGNVQIDDRLIAGAPDSAIGDSVLPASSWSAYLNEAGDTLTFKVKYADGTTVKTGTIALT
jgi:hypothetical protein